jgi:hypothetical protein
MQGTTRWRSKKIGKFPKLPLTPDNYRIIIHHPKCSFSDDPKQEPTGNPKSEPMQKSEQTIHLNLEKLRYANPTELDTAIQVLHKLKGLREEVTRLLQTPILGGALPAVSPVSNAGTAPSENAPSSPRRRRRRRMAGPRPGTMREGIYQLLSAGYTTRKELIPRLAELRHIDRQRAEEVLDSVISNKRDPHIRRTGYGTYSIQGVAIQQGVTPPPPAAEEVQAPRSNQEAIAA